jgi:hypoxanthine phosphoribosyltransferase
VTRGTPIGPNSGRRGRRRSSSHRRRLDAAAAAVGLPATPLATAPPEVETPRPGGPGSARPEPPPVAPAPADVEKPAPWPRADQVEPSFAHASEAEMARILDFYRVRWEYEPHTFPIQWNLDGAVVESFSPDFWLPDLDLYLEMTTLRQKLVRKKNRKLRRVLELYPDLRVKLFYARDFRALMLKFGRLALVEELSGTSGHLSPDRGLAADDLPAIDDLTTDAPDAPDTSHASNAPEAGA